MFPWNPGPGKTYQMTQRSPKSAKGLQKEIHLGETMELTAILDAIFEFEKCPKFDQINLPDLVCHTDNLTSQTGCFNSLMSFFCPFHEDFHWRVALKCFIIEISPWHMLFMVPTVFLLNPGHRKTYKKTQRSTKYIKRLRKEVHHCESLELAAILEAILDFEKCSRVNSIHQADCVYMGLKLQNQLNKKTIRWVRVYSPGCLTISKKCFMRLQNDNKKTTQTRQKQYKTKIKNLTNVCRRYFKQDQTVFFSNSQLLLVQLQHLSKCLRINRYIDKWNRYFVFLFPITSQRTPATKR